MKSIIDWAMSMRSKGITITFELNEYGYFSVTEHYNEYVNGRIIYGMKKNKLWAGRVENAGEYLIDDLEAKLKGCVDMKLR